MLKLFCFLDPVTKALQAKDCNLAGAYKDVALAKECIRDARQDSCWDKVWNRIEQVATSIGITIDKPRSARIQRYRANAATTLENESQTPSDYYRINLYYTFIDHVIQELKVRFSYSSHSGLVAAQHLIPAYLSSLAESDIDCISTYYGKFLLCEERLNFETEIARWKKNYESVATQDRPGNAIDALCRCSCQSFPALRKIFTVFLTTPVGSVACERSFSALRRLKLWTRSSMTEERLSGLAMLLIHRGRDFIPDLEEIYALKCNWRRSQ